MSDNYDIVVVGGGPGGYVAAIRAAQLGLRAAVAERDKLGGICLNWGCIPTKALLKGAEVAHDLSEMQHLGFHAENVSFDIKALVKHSRDVSGRLSGGVEYLLKKNNVDVLRGTARLSGPNQLQITSSTGERECTAAHIILATGARPRSLPGVNVDGKRIWTYFEAMVPEQLPKSLLVVGSGAIGVEFASLYRDLGTDVTIVELDDRLLPAEDKDISEFVYKQFERRGMALHTATSLQSVEERKNSVSCTLKSAAGETHRVTVERVLVAVGVQGNVEDLGLEELGVQVERGFIRTDEWYRTSAPGLYAIGDVTGAPCLAHKASHEGVICVEKIAGLNNVKPLKKSHVPGCTYSRPQVASLGLTEDQAKRLGKRVRVGRFNYSANGKALAIREEAGFVKVVFDEDSGELLGGHMVGAEATEQIQGFGIAQTLEATEHELIETMFSHPTLSEAMHEAVLDAFGKAIHH